jgi:hypothetical protein
VSLRAVLHRPDVLRDGEAISCSKGKIANIEIASAEEHRLAMTESTKVWLV